MIKDITILKWDRNQPRGPKGSPTGGRWVKGVSAGAGSAESFSTVPGMERDRSASYVDALIGATTPPSGLGLKVRGEQYAFGEQTFQNLPRATNYANILALTPETPKAPETPDNSVTETMTKGEVTTVLKKFSGGVNASYKVELALDPTTGENPVKAVFKPEKGEAWSLSFSNHDISRYIKNKEFSLAEREAMASEVSRGLGFGNLVPETHLRTELDLPGTEDFSSDDDEDYGGGYDEDYAREQYDEYKEKRQEEVIDEVGDEMYGRYLDARQEHVEDIQNRVEELQEIWDEEKENFSPDISEYGSFSEQRRHPILEMGPEGFERRDDLGAYDPMDVLDKAGVDVTSRMSSTEKNRVREVIREQLKAGYRDLAELDEDAAKEHLEYDDWRENHEDTENRLYESKIQSFTSWRHSQGMDSEDGGGGGGGGSRNAQAPHPDGGSLQRYVANLENDGDMSHEDATKMAVLDYALGSMDRHDGNVKFLPDLDDDGNQISRPVAIDNGYSMPGSDSPDGFQFRSGAVREWLSDDDHHEVPEARRAPILKALNETDWEAMVDRHPSMSPKERSAFLGRIKNLKEALSYAEGLATLWHDQDLMRH